MSSDSAERLVRTRSQVLGARRRGFGRAGYWLSFVAVLLFGKVMYDNGYGILFPGDMPEYPGAWFTHAAIAFYVCVGLTVASLVASVLLQRAEGRAERREKSYSASNR